MRTTNGREINIALLEKAARALVEKWPAEKFNMNTYMITAEGDVRCPRLDEIRAPFCGTAACFAGAMPWLGIPELEVIDSDFVWSGGLHTPVYLQRTLNISPWSGEFRFIFGARWPHDKHKVLERVLHLKEHGTFEGYKGEGA